MPTPRADSRVCFVGNIPYDKSEEQLITIFSEVGPVAGLRLVFDRETGKPKGYGFCEFFDHETAASAIRNLNDVDVGGRTLRIDWADVDPVFQGRTTQNGQIEGELPKREGKRPGNPNPQGPPPPLGMAGGGGPPSQGPPGQAGFNLNNLPQGTALPPGETATNAISKTLAALPPNQLLDIMSQIKSLILTSPQSAHSLLSSHPQLTYALFQAMLMMNLVDPAILQRILAGNGALNPQQQQQPGPPPPMQAQYPGMPPPRPGPPPPLQQQQQQQQPAYPPSTSYGGIPGMPPSRPPPPQFQGYNNTPPQRPAAPGYPQPPYGGVAGTNTPPQYGTPPQPPPSLAAAVPGVGGPNQNLPDSQRQLLNQVLSLTDAQIAALPADQRESIMMLRRQYGK